MSTRNNGKNNIYELSIAALFIALTYIFTAFINIRLPITAQGGLIHLGNIPLFIGAMIFGKRVGFLAGAFGMALFDLLSGWVLWAPYTFVIVGLMGFVVGLICEKRSEYHFKIIALIAALVIKVVGYYLAESLIYGNWVAPVFSIAGNVIQIGVAALITLTVIVPMKVFAKRIRQ